MKTFKTNIISIYGDKGKAWLTALPRLVEEIAVKWRLSDLQPVINLSYNYVLSGFQGTKSVILKLGLDTEGLHREVMSLKAFADFGAVRVLDEEKGILLLGCAVPGTSLKDYFLKSDLRALQIACQVTQKLHQAPLPEGSFPHIRDWLKALDHGSEFIATRTVQDAQNQITCYLAKARHLRDKLLKNSSDPVLLHGDLHHEIFSTMARTGW